MDHRWSSYNVCVDIKKLEALEKASHGGLQSCWPSFNPIDRAAGVVTLTEILGSTADKELSVRLEDARCLGFECGRTQDLV